MLLLLLACRGAGDGPDRPIPPFTWTDTGVLGTWEEALAFDGDPPRNLLMISIDTLRKDALGRYGGGPTPTLDQLLAESVVLDDHLQCANWTFAATTCTLLGAYPEDLRLWPRLSFVPEPLPDGVPFLAGELARHGFHPILVTGNSWLSPIANNVQGYAEVALPGEGASATAVWEKGAGLLEQALARGEDRWFLHLHLLDPHQPYDPPATYLEELAALEPAPWDLSDKELVYGLFEDWPRLPPEEQALLEAHLRVRYAGEVRWLDDQLAGILADAEARGWLDALLVVWTDHGESFWEHGHATHAWTLHAEENDAILAFRAPNLAPRAWDGPTSAVDLVPTLLAAWDLPIPDTVEGLVLGAAAPGRARFAAVEARSGVEQHVVRDGWKLRFHWSGKAQLYDRRSDPGERHDLFRADDPVARALWEALAPRTEAIRPLAGDVPVTPAGL